MIENEGEVNPKDIEIKNVRKDTGLGRLNDPCNNYRTEQRFVAL
jgi:hypothetical protein